MKIAITGHRGLLGSNMLKLLKEKHHTVVYSEDDYSDLKNVRKLVKACDLVFHFAANMGGIGYVTKYPYRTTMDSLLLDLNVLKACEMEGVKRLFYPGSACMYPEKVSKNQKLKEKDLFPASPELLYGWHKIILEKITEVAPFEVRFGIIHTVFGPTKDYLGEKAKFPSAIAYKVITSKGKPIEIWGDGTQTRTFLYVTDAVKMIYEMTMKDEYFGPVNISSDEVVTVKQCAEWCCKILGIEPKFTFDTSKPSGNQFRGVDNTKWNKYYLYRPETTTREGFEKLIKYMKKYIHV